VCPATTLGLRNQDIGSSLVQAWFKLGSSNSACAKARYARVAAAGGAPDLLHRHERAAGPDDRRQPDRHLRAHTVLLYLLPLALIILT
jgi:hypothetical protein